MSYRINYKNSALKDMKRIPKNDLLRVQTRIRSLANNPRPPGVLTMHGEFDGHLRVRVGKYRIVYQVYDDHLLVWIVTVGDRKDVYR